MLKALIRYLRAFVQSRCVLCGCWWNEHEMFCDRHPHQGCGVPPEPTDWWAHNDAIMTAHENRLFALCPSACWLEPTRWTRPSWPAKPTEADLSWDKSQADLLLANATLTDPAQIANAKHRLEQMWLGGPISSKRTFDRRY